MQAVPEKTTIDGDDHATTRTLADFLRDMNPYVDEFTRPPAFHKFRGLPLELRYKIYENYLFDDVKSITSRMWPVITIDLDLCYGQFKRQTSELFLPKLCEVNRVIRAEVMLFIAKTATYQIDNAASMRRVMGIMDRASMCRDTRMLPNIYKLNLADVNDMTQAFLRKFDAFEGYMVDQADAACNFVVDSLSAFSSIRALGLSFSAPTFNTYAVWDHYEAAPVDRFMDRFDMLCITALEQLQTVTLKGLSGFSSWRDFVGGALGVPDGEKREHLETIVGMARDLKDKLMHERREVEVQVQLVYADEHESMKL